MSLPNTLLECIENTASDPVIRIRVNPDLFCDLIRKLKTDSRNILRKFVGILLHDGIKTHTVGIINPDCQGIGYAILLKIDQRIPQILFFFNLQCYLLRLSFADTFNLCQTFRFFLHDSQGIIAKLFHDSGRQCRTHALYCPGSQISLNSHTIRRSYGSIGAELELPAVHRMLNIVPLCRDILSLCETLRHTHAGNLLALGNQAEHSITIFFVLKDDVIHIAVNCFHICSPFCLLVSSVYCVPRNFEKWIVSDLRKKRAAQRQPANSNDYFPSAGESDDSAELTEGVSKP